MQVEKKRTPIPQGVRFDVFRRDNFTCVYCGAKSPDIVLECDHKIAVANGGTDNFDNLVTACWDCNRGKGTKTVKHSAQYPRPVSSHHGSAANDNGLVGLYGHSRDDDGKIDWQFQITGMVGSEACTIQLFSWMDGRATDIKIVLVSDLTTKQYSLYGSRDEWLWRWAVESAKESGRGVNWARKTFRISTGREFGEAA